MSNPIVYYTAEEVAALLKITRFTVYKMINRGELPGYRIGREFRIEAADLDAFIRKSKEQLRQNLSL
ncbi:helix-turn-helix domain-containing protein [Sporomusa sp. KB1]|jgi:putative molybdopterin biosynthesis protein|uniref:helix-turn-helix domain-containing protein n=1 Tax=Sporomusa sp. KB1 TaxID=943346 RepID=UPI00119FE659|nr:helix-turn-helix domain-containing protein [Sporomusa sp. KB1]TWH51614.1 AlpA family transcriptional regulator [Sporomusa sp. KB1]TWH52193.1 AlpA family transcriptional regulator [Sporomusa sp. KB1]